MALLISAITVRHDIRRIGEEVARLAQVWIQDLISFIPVGRRAPWARALRLPHPLVVTCNATGGFHEVGGAGDFVSPNAFAERGRARLLVLRLGEEQVLRRRLELPAAAAARLDSALAINLRTWTPFESSEVYAAACPLLEGSQRLPTLRAVELRCVPRSLVDDRIEALQSFGLDPDAIELGDARFPIFRATLKRRRMRKRSWLTAALALLLLAQTVAVYAILTHRQHAEIEGLEALRNEQVAAFRRQAKADKEAAARQADLRRISARLEEGFSFSHALRLLGEALPQGTVIREFEASRDRAEGHMVILGAPDLDVVAMLAATGFYRVGDLSVLPNAETGRRTFSSGFSVIPWAQANGQGGR